MKYLLFVFLLACNSNCYEICTKQEDALLMTTFDGTTFIWLPYKKCVQFNTVCEEVVCTKREKVSHPTFSKCVETKTIRNVISK